MNLAVKTVFSKFKRNRISLYLEYQKSPIILLEIREKSHIQIKLVLYFIMRN